MIKVKFINSEYCPIFECDVCRRSINQLRGGIYVFNPSDSREVYFLHKDCSFALSEKFFWDELAMFIEWIGKPVQTGGKQ